MDIPTDKDAEPFAAKEPLIRAEQEKRGKSAAKHKQEKSLIIYKISQLTKSFNIATKNRFLCHNIKG